MKGYSEYQTEIKEVLRVDYIPLALRLVDARSLVKELGREYLYYMRKRHALNLVKRYGYMQFVDLFIILMKARKLRGHKIIIHIPKGSKEEFVRLIFSMPVYRELRKELRKGELNRDELEMLFLSIVMGKSKAFERDFNHLYKDIKGDEGVLRLLRAFSKNDIEVKFDNKLIIEVKK